MMGWYGIKTPLAYVAPGSGPFDCRGCGKPIDELPEIDPTVFTPYHGACVPVRDEMPPAAIGK